MCGYDSLNVALTAPPTVGTDLLPNDAYLNSSWWGAYCDNGTGGCTGVQTGTFRLNEGYWTGYQPAIKVTTEKILLGKATGGLRLNTPKQQISFEAYDYGVSNTDEGKVEYQNFEYPGGLHYTASILCSNVNKGSHEAWFMFQIPEGYPGLSGYYVVSYVKDVGTPGTKGDIYGHTATTNESDALSWCETGTKSVTSYPIISGNLVVHK